MTTAKELIEFLKQFPEDSIIEILKEVSCGYESYTTFENLSLGEGEYHIGSYGLDVLDYRGKVYSSLYDGKVVIRLGEQ